MLRKKLADMWQNSGIDMGDTILIHSSIKRTLSQSDGSDCEKSKIEDLFNSFFDAVGENGTILFPLFNFGFCKGESFHYYETVSKMGYLTEFARSQENTYRTHHPIYSFAIFGKNVDKFRYLENISSYGKDSPFEVLKNLDGKIASLDLEDQNSMTFYHHVEELLQVEYRYNKTFSGEYIDYNYHKSIKSYDMYARNLDKKVMTYVNPMSEILWENGIYKGDRPFIDSGLRVAKAKEIFQITSDIINSGKAENILFQYLKS